MAVANEARSDELAIIVSYPTNASGIIVSLKNVKYIVRILPDFICKDNRFFVSRRVQLPYLKSMVYWLLYQMAKPIRALELRYPMIQFLIIDHIHVRDGPLEKLWEGGGEFSSCKNFFSLSNSLHEFYLGHCTNIF